MHNVLFNLKRLHLTAQRYASEALRAHGLTPARFDVLHIVGGYGGLSQAHLRRKLGVARSTISRMLSSMERRGLISRFSLAPQRAEKWVRLTDLARALFVQLSLLARPAVAAAVGFIFEIRPNAFMQYVAAMFMIDSHMQYLRARARDRASMFDPYGDFNPDR
ncbi:MAG: MarR family transcriptional regulator [Myxococcales bacterium]|nr:MarR family transcriptional regulator [Myxococcales bacterium]